MPSPLTEAEKALLESLMRAFLGGTDVGGTERINLASLSFAAEHGAELITDIDKTTTERANSLIQQGLEENWSVNELQLKLMDGEDGPFGRNRALMIARTETAFAQNQGEAARWLDDGVKHVEIVDGDGDEACAEANGAVWTIEDYLDHPIAHPNCGRSALPIEDGELGGRKVSRPHESEEENTTRLGERLARGGQFASISTERGGPPTPREFAEGA